MRAAFLLALAIIGLVAVGATIAMRFREAAARKIVRGTYDVSVPGAFGYQSSTSGWEFNARQSAPSGSTTCVTVTGSFPEGERTSSATTDR